MARIAEHAGVSEATVSRVLNNKSNVAEETRAAVLTSIDVLGFERPSHLRSRMGAGPVGLIVPELTNPVFPLFAQVIQQRLAAKGFTAVLCTQAPGGVAEEDYLPMLLDHDVCGIIFVSGKHAESNSDISAYQKLLAEGVPIVMINGHRPEIAAPSLSTDERAAVALAFDHLVQLGHERIGLATGQPRYVPSIRKVAEFERQVAAAGMEKLIEQTWFTVEGGELAGRSLIAQGATGIICGSDLMALGVMRAATQLGLTVPTDLSVIGYDGSDITKYTGPPLTTIRQDVATMSAAAADALAELVKGHPQPSGDALFAPELLVRGSTGRAPYLTGVRHDPRTEAGGVG
nr:LacI family DNA-binding transcriptional regulator [Flexivirga oryzae]